MINKLFWFFYICVSRKRQGRSESMTNKYNLSLNGNRDFFLILDQIHLICDQRLTCKFSPKMQPVGWVNSDLASLPNLNTSNFSASATETAEMLSKRIVLIDGQQLAKLMIRYNVGCRVEDTLHIKKIDEDFFEDE